MASDRMSALPSPVDNFDDPGTFRQASICLSNLVNARPNQSLYGAKLVAANAWAHEAVKRMSVLMENHYPPKDEESNVAELLPNETRVKDLLALMAKGTCRVREVIEGLYEVSVKETGGRTAVYSFRLDDETDAPQEKEPEADEVIVEGAAQRSALAYLLGVEPSEVTDVRTTGYIVRVTQKSGNATQTHWHRVSIND